MRKRDGFALLGKTEREEGAEMMMMIQMDVLIELLLNLLLYTHTDQLVIRLFPLLWLLYVRIINSLGVISHGLIRSVYVHRLSSTWSKKEEESKTASYRYRSERPVNRF